MNQHENRINKVTIQEIFNTPAVRSVEREIIDVMREIWRSPANNDWGKVTIQRLLKVRKDILNPFFVLTDECKELLTAFNNNLINAQLNMRKQLLNMQQLGKNAGLNEAEFTGKLFMSYKYPEIHPIQSSRAKKIWNVMNGSYDNFIPLYESGVNELHVHIEENMPSENNYIYLSEDVDNWNEGLYKEKTADMNICFAFHYLYDNTEFSIFDLLWVRDFCIELSCESTYCTDSTNWDKIDWGVCDFYD